MATNSVVKVMRSLSNNSFEDLKMTAENECISIPKHISKVELITLIISARASREARDSVYKMIREESNNNNDREKYCLHAESKKYYLRLTTEQATMLEWCLDNEINFYNAELESVGEIEWETP
jgi:hypothetical protein